MKRLLREVKRLKDSQVSKTVGKRLKEFSRAGKGSASKLFNELCFCLLTANFNAERVIRIQEEMGKGFLTLSEARLGKKLAALGHRFPNARANYIVGARKYVGSLEELVKSSGGEAVFREWLVRNVKGLGYKEASHFLRNIGYKDSAIIDFHIIDLLVRHGLAEKPKTLGRMKYLEIEDLLRRVAGKAGMNLAELDLYLWYSETGKVLK